MLGFDVRWVDALFGWSYVGSKCQECHLTKFVRTLQELQRDSRLLTSQLRANQHTELGWLRDALCVLPLMAVDPTHEGSTGRLRFHVR